VQTGEEKIDGICRYSGIYQLDILRNALNPMGPAEQSQCRLVICWTSFRQQPFNTWSNWDLVRKDSSN